MFRVPFRPIKQSFEIGVDGAGCIGFGDVLFPPPIEVECAIGFSSSREWLPKDGGLDGIRDELCHDGGSTTGKAEYVNGVDGGTLDVAHSHGRSHEDLFANGVIQFS